MLAGGGAIPLPKKNLVQAWSRMLLSAVNCTLETPVQSPLFLPGCHMFCLFISFVVSCDCQYSPVDLRLSSRSKPLPAKPAVPCMGRRWRELEDARLADGKRSQDAQPLGAVWQN